MISSKNMLFDRNRLILKSLSKRVHDFELNAVKPLRSIRDYNELYVKVAQRIFTARNNNRPIILMAGAHVLRDGVQRYLIDLMRREYITCIAVNGAGIIHDYELSLIGATTEKVARYINEGQFGLWRETGQINDIINDGYKRNYGMGEAVGKAIYEGDFPHKNLSILAAGYELNIPVTVHVGIGYDIIHEHPNCSGAATGETSYKDFLSFAKVLESLDKGVVMNFGSAVMAPEVFLKGLSMAKNVSRQKGSDINNFTTLVCDLHNLPDDFSREPSKDTPFYYYRPWKTMLVRTVADGGESFYIKGRHSETIPSLWTSLNDVEEKNIF